MILARILLKGGVVSKGRDVSVSVKSRSSRTLTVNLPGLFSTIAKSALKAAGGNLPEAGAEMVDVFRDFNYSATTDERVATLVLRALERSLATLASELTTDWQDSDVYAASFLGLSDNVTFKIDLDFFDGRNNQKIIEEIASDARRWLNALDVPSVDVENIIGRLPSVFSRMLHVEWKSNAEYYSPIVSDIDTPFKNAARMERQWDVYRDYLVALPDERVFDESFSLRQIYVPLRFYYDLKGEQSADAQTFDDLGASAPRHVVGWCQSEIWRWIEEADRDRALRVIAGGPGSGKSSLAKMLASDIASKGRDVLFLPLHQVDLEAGVVAAISDYFLQAGHFTENPTQQARDGTLIIILDGLDEIQMQGRAAQEAAQSFVNDLARFVDRRNTTRCQLLCLITGRDLAVQAAEGLFKGEGQLMHLLPYSISEIRKDRCRDDDGIFDVDQRNEWWRKYGILTDAAYEAMPDPLSSGELGDVTAQPLLNYLVALAHRQGMAIDGATNVNSVYAHLLRAVYDRGWARNAHPSIKDVGYKDFARLLEEVALSVWHGAGRTTTVSEVEAHCRQSKVGALLPTFQSGVSSGISSLLLAFYFRQKGRRDGGEKTFEFTHKSFAEYLTSLRIIRLIKFISDQKGKHNSEFDGGMDDEDLLHRWILICGRTSMDGYLLDFVRREIASDQINASQWQDDLGQLLTFALMKGWPIHRKEGLSFSEQMTHVRNAEETLLACLNACALSTGRKSNIRWPNATSAGDMIKRLQGQRQGPRNRTVMDCLSFLDYSGQCFDLADLYRAEMHNSDFGNAQLNYTVLLQANLSNCDMSRAVVSGATLVDAKISGATFPVTALRRGWLEHGHDRFDNIRENYEIALKRGATIVDDNNVEMKDEAVKALADRRARGRPSATKKPRSSPATKQ